MSHALRSRLLALLLLLLPVVLLVAGPREETPDGLPAVPDAVRTALMAENWEGALTQLARLDQEQTKHADMWELLRSVALAGKGDDAAVIKALEGFAERHVQSPWRHKANFGLARAYRRQRRFEEAEGIYEEAARRLRSGARQAELAQVYIDFADQLSTPPDPAQPADGSASGDLDYGRALVLYSKVEQLDAPRAMQDHARYRMAFCAEKVQDWTGALQLYRAYTALFDPARPSALSDQEEPGSHVFAARLGAGIALLRTNQRAAARRTFEDLIAIVAEARAGAGVCHALWSAADAEQRKSISALAARAELALASTFEISDAYGGALAVAALQRYIEHYPTEDAAIGAAYRIGSIYAGLGRTEDALRAFDELLAHKAVAGKDEAQRKKDELLMRSALFNKGQLRQGQKQFEVAIAIYSDYVRRHPTGAHWSPAQQGIVNCEYAIGALRQRRGQQKEAREAFHAFLDKHPLDARARGIQLIIGQLYIEEAQALVEQDAEASKAQVAGLLKNALARWAEVTSRYPGSNEASDALYRTALVHETRRGDLQAAVTAYRRCNFGTYGSHAAARLMRMTQPELTLITERTWRSDEAARVKVQLRNIESVKVQVYRLDLEAYFRKHLTHERVEDLDLDLIAADINMDVAIEEYAEYLPIEREIEIPVEGPGVWAVAVTADNARATTLVLRSDLDIIVKSSRRETLIFAEDMRLGQAAAGVELLVGMPRQGGKIEMRTVVTGADGVARLTLEEGSELGLIQVLANRAGHFASNGLSLDGLGLSTELEPRGAVFTDRSVYRPGQTVSWRAILRSVQDGHYHFEAGQSWRIEVADPMGRVFAREELELSDFGTLHANLELAAGAATGTYQIRCTRANGPVFNGSFLVEEFRLVKIELALETERDVYYRGEQVDVQVRAAYYYGEPVADTELRIDLPDGRRLDLRTDEKGAAHFSFDTREFNQSGRLGFRAVLARDGVQRSTSIFLASHGFEATLEARRKTVLLGEELALELRTRTPDGKATGRAGQLQLLRRDSQRGQWIEVLVEERTVQTEDEQGRTLIAFTPPRGGHYVVRYEGQDRFGNPVLASAQAFVSGLQDEVQLRLLTETAGFDVGAEVQFELHNRAGAGLALITFEGERILGYRIVRLTEGRNRIGLQIDHEHYPSFALSAALMEGNRFHTASRTFEVRRHLNVKVLPERESYAPGEKAVVHLEVSDQLGRPVAAELSLAVIDAALFELHADVLPPLQTIFAVGTQRVAALKSSSSVAFTYRGVTRTISSDVIDEAGAQQRAQQWQRLDLKELTDQLLALGYVDPSITPGNEWSFFEGELADAAGYNALEHFDIGGEHETRTKAKASVIRNRAYKSVPGSGGGRGGSGPTTPGPSGGGGGGAMVLQSRSIRLPDDGRTGLDPETAFWTPAVVSDAEGHARIEFRVPPISTRWRLSCRGVSADTQVGEALASLITKADFFVELVAPALLLEGDEPRFVARVHNLTGKPGNVELQLRLTAPGLERSMPVKLQVGASGVVEHIFPQTAALPGGGRLELELEAHGKLEGDLDVHDILHKQVRLRPWGLAVQAARSGILSSEATLLLDLPAKTQARGRSVELQIGPSVARHLIDTALGQGTRLRSMPFAATHADTASDLIGVTAIIGHLARTARSTIPEARTLRRRAQGLLAQLIAGQDLKGGWPLRGSGSDIHVQTTCRVVHALAAARTHGLHVPAITIERALSVLQNEQRTTGRKSSETKAMVLHARALFGREDFAAANRLHRERTTLSNAGLAHTALALIAMGRGPLAAEMARVLESRAIIPSGQREPCSWSAEKNLGWNRSELEMLALNIMALEQALPESATIAEGSRYLLQRCPWPAGRTRGLALAAVSTWQVETQRLEDRMQISAEIAGQALPVISLSTAARGSSQRIEIPDEHVGPVRVKLSMRGRGKPHYTVILRGFATDLKPTPHERFRVTNNRMLADVQRYRGAELRAGFNTMSHSIKTWQNKVENLPVGQVTRCRVDFYSRNTDSVNGSRPDYLTLEISLPAGARVLKDSVTSHLPWEQRDGALYVHMPRQGSGAFEYSLIGVLPGAYRILPPVLRSAYAADGLAIGASRKLTVLERDAKSPDKYRQTPDELFHLGGRMYAAGDRQNAARVLTELMDDYGDRLHERTLTEAATMLLYLSIEFGSAEEVVRYFEVLKEKNPDLMIPFEEVLAVGEAYRELEEYERALLIFIATIQETYGKDLKVAGTFSEMQESAGSLDTLARLWLEYPDLPIVVESSLALSDLLLEQAPKAHADASLRRAGRDRASLSLQGILVLQRFLSLYPQNPLAPEAGLNLVSAYLDIEDHETAAELAGSMAELYTDPHFADAFLFTRAVAQWTRGYEDESLDLLQRIVDASYDDEEGNSKPSENKDLALYILGQIHHAKQDSAKATEYYEKVQHLFVDAREALAGFRKKEISIPELTTVKPEAKIELELEYRNVREAELLVYAVDLMTLYLREKNLSHITAVNLAGISPTLTRTVALGKGRDMRPQNRTVELELPGAGAYLVICRGDELHTSGLILVSDLELEVHEEPGSGRLRVQALAAQDGAYLRDVDVRVVGASSGRFVTGRTDPRGLFVADDVRGASTVIARLGQEHYAFYRGTAALVDVPAEQARESDRQSLEGGQQDYLKNVEALNDFSRAGRLSRYQSEVDRERKGVQVKQVK